MSKIATTPLFFYSISIVTAFVYLFFPQLLILENIRFSPHSALFSYDVNLFVLPFVWYIWWYVSSSFDFNKISTKPMIGVILRSTVYIFVLANIAIQANFVSYELVDFTQYTNILVWVIANLFVTAPIEEIIYRLFLPFLFFIIIGKKMEWNRIMVFSLILSSAIFGLYHHSGGIVLVALATLSGLFYSYIYFKYKNIMYPIVAHFMVNFIHLLFFTYPHSL